MLLDPYAPLVKGRAKFAERDTFERFQEQVPPQSSLCHPAAAHTWTLIILSHYTEAECCHISLSLHVTLQLLLL